MKIIFDLRATLVPCRTGVVQYCNHLLKTLLKIDNQNSYVLFWTGVQKPNIDEEILTNPRIKKINIRIPNRLLNLSLFLFNQPRFNLFLNTYTTKTIHFVPHFLHTPVSKQFKKIITVHDLSFKYFPQFFTYKNRFWHFLNKIKKNLEECNKIIAISESTKNDIIKFYQIAPQKIKVIYHGIDHNQYKKITDYKYLEKARSRLNLPKDYLLYLGPIEPRKNIDLIIRVFKNLTQNKTFSKLKLVIAGFVMDSKIVKTTKNVLWYQNIREEDKVIFYNLAKVFIYPSFFEGFGFPPLEAGACGTPVIAGNTSSLAETLGDTALLVNPHRANELKIALLGLLTNKGLYNHYQNKIIQKSSTYTWQKSARQTLKLFKSVSDS